MSNRKDIRCILQYLVDKIPYIADNVNIEKIGSFDMGMNVDAVSLYSGEDDLPKPGNIYLCRPEHLHHLSKAYQKAVLFCVNNGPHISSLPDGFNIILINCSQSLEYVFNALQKTIINLKMNNVLLDRAILEETSIPDIVSIAEQNFTNPFLLFDADFKLLGWSKSRQCSDPLYTESVQLEELPQKYILRLISQNIFRKLNIHRTIILSKEHSLSQSTVVMVMLKNEELVIGYGMLICSKREVRQAMIQGFEEFINKLEAKLARTSEISYLQNRNDSYFYVMLLNGRITDIDEILRAADELHISKTGGHLIHVIQCMGSTPSRYAFRAFAKDVVNKEIAFVYGDSILVIESLSGGGAELLKKTAYHKFLADYQAKAGISASFSKIQDIRYAYVQASRSIKIGVKLSCSEEATYFDYNQRVYRYADYVQYMMIEREYAATKHFPLTYLRLIKLISLDEEKNTELTRTLIIYLRNNGHIIGTAQEMFFHRNSILNRIKQISEILNMDLSDYKTREELLFNFKVIDYAKSIGKTAQLMELTE